MLKPADQGPGGPDPKPAKKIGELLNRLVDDGKAYAEAELQVGKAIIEQKVAGIKVPALLVLAAMLFLQAAVVMLGMTVYATLVSRLGPFGAGILSTALFLGIAAALGWWAAKRAKDLL